MWVWATADLRDHPSHKVPKLLLGELRAGPSNTEVSIVGRLVEAYAPDNHDMKRGAVEVMLEHGGSDEGSPLKLHMKISQAVHVQEMKACLVVWYLEKSTIGSLHF